MTILAFFNNKGGVGKTTLVYHLAMMMAERGERVLAVDLDPQANLSGMFLTEERLEELWPEEEKHPLTIQGVLAPITRGVGDVEQPHIERISPNLGLLVGDLALSAFEDKLSSAWPLCHNGDESAFRVMTAFYRAIRMAASSMGADRILVDVGPNLGAINRSALIACDYVVTPLGPDLFSMQGLRNLGPTVRDWRKIWGELRGKCPDPELDIPPGRITPLGYIVMQSGMRESRPVKAYKRWVDRFPGAWRAHVLAQSTVQSPSVEYDRYCLGILKHYRSLMPMAMEAHKPVFALKPADGAIGAHGQSVRDAFEDFSALVKRIDENVVPPGPASLS